MGAPSDGCPRTCALAYVELRYFSCRMVIPDMSRLSDSRASCATDPGYTGTAYIAQLPRSEP